MPAKQPSSAWIAGEGLKYFTSGDNAEYLADELLLWQRDSIEHLRTASKEGFRILMEAASHVAANNLWKTVGIPKNAVPLVTHSLQKELDLYCLGRFDFAGGIETHPAKILEFNADTFSLLPETAWIQNHILSVSGKEYLPVFNKTFDYLRQYFKQLLAKYPQKEPSLLLTWMGHQEDQFNLDVIGRAATAAGFKVVQPMLLERVIFSEDEGVFIELSPERYRQYDFVFKMAPWDFIAYDEPDLMDILTQIVTKDLAVIINPAYAMLLQSKGLLKVASTLYPDHPNLLKTTDNATDFPDGQYVEKPIFGRVGDNVRVFTGASKPAQANDGDYGHLPKVYQQLASLEQDPDGYFYQPSTYVMKGEAVDIAVRRQEDLIIDDDAEFIASGIMI